MKQGIDPVTLEILWSRLVGITDEAAIILIRSCFSSIVRDSHDFSIGLFDDRKRLVAQCSTSTPGQIGCMLPMIENFCRVFPAENLQPGDALITNDPWQASTHLNDITIASPIFYQKKLVGFGLCTVHHLDIGGRYATLESQEIFEEGLWIPISKIYKEGVPNEDVFNFIRHNVRVPEKIIGDLRAQMSANYLLSIRINELLEEYDLENLEQLSDEIISRTEDAIRAEIRKIPDGTYPYTIYLDKLNGEEPKICVAVQVIGDKIVIDFEGTSPQVPMSINSCLNITYSYAAFAIKSIVNPYIPNNLGSMRPISVKAAEGSLVNPKWPAPVWGRTQVIHRLPDAIYCALSSVLPDRTIAENGSSPLGSVALTGERQGGQAFLTYSFFFGGMGARSTKDGVSCLGFPCIVSNTPIEVLESDAPILWEKKELMCDSGGAGKFRGGCGQEFIFRVPKGQIGPKGTIFASLKGGRFDNPVHGILKGKDSKPAQIFINNKKVKSGKRFTLKPGDVLKYRVSGGGGYGNPLDRDLDLVEEDIRNGLVSLRKARKDYKVIFDKKRSRLDRKATERLRAC